VEKKRRDRINKSLDELKDLMALTDEVKFAFFYLLFRKEKFSFNREQDTKN
jgi:hypothetical protein